MSQIRVAVDQTAKDILEEYFAEHNYGKQLVREIPRRVTAAIARRFDSPLQAAALNIKAAVPTSDGNILVEGLFSTRSASKSDVTRIFTASFDAAGELVGLRQRG